MDKQSLINEIEQTLIQTNQQLIKNEVFGNTPWTREMKKALGNLGKSRGFKICAACKDEDFETEWLYDLIWYKENLKGNLIEVPLAVESEWSMGWKHIKFDFEKLLVANATLKLMICCSYEKDIPPLSEE
ncbi:hypothetical protein [Foetidibacter luteolus]|uniref:hypothetical protein n=1 Tax=Foetidibacter luteolus TaxID=2608880 RepID=UPI00129B6038|nr:hypothetical protein [Foetidibacter luteolus]